MKFKMDETLEHRLTLWHEQIEVLAKIESKYHALEASEKSLFGQLFLQAIGRSIMERESKAYDSQTWKDFKLGLAVAKTQYLKERRILELKIKAYESCYLTYKLESDAIRKGRGGQP